MSSLTQQGQPLPSSHEILDGDGKTFNARLVTLFDDPVFSDYAVHCGDTVFNVNSAVVAAQCGWFKTLILNGYKESKEKAVKIEETDPGVMKALLGFCYGCRYSVEDCNSTGLSAFEFHAQVCTAAEYYDVPILATAAGNILRLSYCTWADDQIATNFRAVLKLYNETVVTDSYIRQVVKDILLANRSKCFNDKKLWDEIRSCPDLAADLITNLMTQGYGIDDSAIHTAP